MKLPKYPLEQLFLIKKKRLEEAEKKLKEKKLLLEKEEQKLKTLEEECQVVHEHKQAKIKQLEEEMNAGTHSHKLDIANKYLEVVQEDLLKKKKKVAEQQKVVQAAVEQVNLARADMLKKQQDIEKLDIHKAEWKKEVLREIAHKEALEGDEIGSAKHISLKREKELHEKALKKKKQRGE